MALNNCHFQFSNQHGVFYSGDLVKGSVNIVLDESEKVSEIILEIFGDAKCSWSENYSTGSSSTVIHYIGEDTYIDETINLLEGKFFDNDGCTVLPAGKNKFEFSIPIPAEVQTSFEGKFGRIRYTAKVTMKRPGKFDKSSKVSFTVVRHRDLNLFPHLKEPIEINDHKHFHVLFARTGRLNVSGILPVTGYVPGQFINFKCHIHNESRVVVTEVIFNLRQVTEYTVENPYKRLYSLKKNLSEFQSAGLDKGHDKEYEVRLQVPAVPPSSDPDVPTILKISYYIKIKAVISGFHKDFKVEMPVEIGTIPFSASEEKSNAVTDEHADYDWSMYEETQIDERVTEVKDGEGDQSLGYIPKYRVFPSQPIESDFLI